MVGEASGTWGVKRFFAGATCPVQQALFLGDGFVRDQYWKGKDRLDEIDHSQASWRVVLGDWSDTQLPEPPEPEREHVDSKQKRYRHTVNTIFSTTSCKLESRKKRTYTIAAAVCGWAAGSLLTAEVTSPRLCAYVLKSLISRIEGGEEIKVPYVLVSLAGPSSTDISTTGLSFLLR